MGRTSSGPTRSTRRALAGAGLSCVLLVGCASAENALGTATEKEQTVSGQTAIPTETLTDWVSYGDSIAVVAVVSEKESPIPEEEAAAGEGSIDRSVVLRVDNIVWRRPGSGEVPKSLEVAATGWLFKGEKRTPFNVNGLTRMTVGDSYLMPLAKVDGNWDTISMQADLDKNNQVVAGEGESPQYEVVLEGLSVEEAASLIERTEPEKAAAEAPADAGPVQRWEAVRKARDGAG